MTISSNGNAGGAFGDAEAAATYNFGGATLPVGSLVVVGGAKYSEASHPFVAGDCTKSAGTAAISTVTLNRADGGDVGGARFAYSAVWSFRITTAGTCTVQVTGDADNSYMIIGADCFTTDASWDESREESENGATNAGDALTSMSSGNATSAGAALFFGVLSVNDGVANTITPDGAFTTIYEQETVDHQVGSIIRRIVSSGTTDAADWTFNTLNGSAGNGVAATLVVFKEAAGSALNVDEQEWFTAERQTNRSVVGVW
jgi:hypothetical protein